MASLKEWTPPPDLALVSGADGQLVAQLQLGSAGPIPSQLEVTDGRLIWASHRARTAGAQQVDLPGRVGAEGTNVALVANRRALRLVGN